jgi:hypothetical protein
MIIDRYYYHQLNKQEQAMLFSDETPAYGIYRQVD